MPVEDADDRAAFLDSDDFGVEATYKVAGEDGAEVAIVGIFDTPHQIAAFDNADVADRRPTFFCDADDLPEEASGQGSDTLTIDGVTRKVVAHEPDGQGMVLLRLAA